MSALVKRNRIVLRYIAFTKQSITSTTKSETILKEFFATEPQSRYIFDMRQLLPHYYVSTRPVGWKCSECEQVFGNRSELDPQQQPEAPSSIQAEFTDHNCETYRANVKARRQSLGV